MKKTILFIFLLQLSLHTMSAQNSTTKKHVPITAFWFNGGWDYYDPNALKYLDEIIIFAIAPNPNTGELYTYNTNNTTGEITYQRNSGAGLTTTMVKTIVKEAKKNNVKLTIGINGMGKKEKIFNALVKNDKHDVFAQNIKDFCLKYKIDGVDVDYEHPGNENDVVYLKKIFMALSTNLKPHGIHISGAFGIQRKYGRIFLKENHNLLDQINVMCYVKPAAWFEKELNLLHTELGIPKHKIYGGVGFYGKDKKNKVNIVYRDLIKLTPVNNTEDIFTIPNPSKPKQTLNLLYHNSEKSLSKKVEFIRNNEFGGIMVWELSNDVPTTDPNSRIKFLRGITQ